MTETQFESLAETINDIAHSQERTADALEQIEEHLRPISSAPKAADPATGTPEIKPAV